MEPCTHAGPPATDSGPTERGRRDAGPAARRSPSDVVAAIIDEVPSYADAFAGRWARPSANAVQLALGGFLYLASGRRGADPGTPTAPAVEGAYELGRGEARSGRSMDALLGGYRVGARVAWREMSTTAVRTGV